MTGEGNILIRLNGGEHTVPASASVAELLQELGLHSRLAVEINQHIIPRSRHGTHRLREGDQVEIVQAVGGG